MFYHIPYRLSLDATQSPLQCSTPVQHKTPGRKPRVPPTPDVDNSDEHDTSDQITGKLAVQNNSSHIISHKMQSPSSSWKTNKSQQNQNIYETKKIISTHVPNSSTSNTSVLNSNIKEHHHQHHHPSSSYLLQNNSNNSNNNQSHQQQQLLGQSDRISKEKQKFFRHSAFNSERIVKTSPPSAVINIQARNKATTQPQIQSISQLSPSERSKLLSSKFSYESSSDSDTPHPSTSTKKLNGQTLRTNKSYIMDSKEKSNNRNIKKENESSDSSSSCSSTEDDDDDDESTSSESCSSSDNSDNESDSSSSEETSSSDEDDTNNKITNVKKPIRANETNEIGKRGWQGVAGSTNNQFKSSTTSSARSSSNCSNKSKVFQVPFGESSADSSWGFAAEAKKGIEVLSSTKDKANVPQRIFGNFSGIDKDVLVKVDPKPQISTFSTSSKAPTSTTTTPHNNKTDGKSPRGTGPMKGLFDSLTPFFTVTDYTRSRQGAISSDSSSSVCNKQKQLIKTQSTSNQSRSAIPEESPNLYFKETRSTYKSYAKTLLDQKSKQNPIKTDINKTITTNKNTLSTSSSGSSIKQKPIAEPSKIVKCDDKYKMPSISNTIHNRHLNRIKKLDHKTQSSSEDDILNFSPSKLVKTSVNSQKLEYSSKLASAINNDQYKKLFGFNAENNLDFASIRENSCNLSLVASSAPHNSTSSSSLLLSGGGGLSSSLSSSMHLTNQFGGCDAVSNSTSNAKPDHMQPPYSDNQFGKECIMFYAGERMFFFANYNKPFFYDSHNFSYVFFCCNMFLFILTQPLLEFDFCLFCIIVMIFFFKITS